MTGADPATSRSRSPWIELVRTLAGGLVSLGGCATLGAALLVSGGRIGGPPGWSVAEVRTWFGHQPVGAVFRGLAVLGLIVVLYLVVTTVALMLAAVAHTARCPRLGAVAQAVSVPVVRRAVAAALGLSITMATAAPAPASPGPHTIGRTTRFAGSPPPDAVATMRALAPPPTLAAPAPVTSLSLDDTWVIRPGDHLWGLAAAALAEAHDTNPTDAEIAGFVARIVVLNRDRLAVPDHPDLIFPGQVFDRPPVTP